MPGPARGPQTQLSENSKAPLPDKLAHDANPGLHPGLAYDKHIRGVHKISAEESVYACDKFFYSE